MSTLKITLQPFFIFYASRLREVIKIKMVGASAGEPSLSVIHHESKAASVASTPSSRFKERIIQVSWTSLHSSEEQSMTFVLPLCAYGNEALRLSFQWPSGEVRPHSHIFNGPLYKICIGT
jgi:hypothetical protein